MGKRTFQPPGQAAKFVPKVRAKRELLAQIWPLGPAVEKFAQPIICRLLTLFRKLKLTMLIFC